MIVLDTNVVSELMRPVPDRHLLKWLDAQSPDTLWLTSVNVAELLFGIARLAEGARKRSMAQTIASMLEEDFAHQILSFDVEAAVVFATMAAQRDRQGQPMGKLRQFVWPTKPALQLATRGILKA